MSVRLIRAAEQDDAAFRARLAPLASEVLPAPPATAPRQRAMLFSRRNVALAGALVTLLAITGAAWRFSERLHLTGSHVGGPATPVGAPTASPPVPASVQPATPPAPAATVKTAVQPVPAAATQPTPAPAPALSPADSAMIALLLRRGDNALAEGDIIAARLLFEQAAGMGSAAAATATGKTYDAEFLAQSGAHGIRPDQVAAATWFRKAAALGDGEARARLARIEGQPRP